MDENFLISNKDMLASLGLNATPFPVTPDPTHYFIIDHVEEKIFELMHFIYVRKGFLLFTADAGIGKSTLSRYLMMHLEMRNTQVSLVVNTFLQGVELIKAINQDFGVEASGGLSEQLNALNKFLLDEYSEGKNCLIIIDDAQNLSIESLEMIRQISNFEANNEKVVQILLVAQPEIINTLRKPEIRQLRSRIALHVEMMPLTMDETRQYVVFKLNSAGNEHHIRLTYKALKLLYKHTKGYPRQINAIMDRALYVLYVKERYHIDDAIIEEAVKDLNRAEGALNPYYHVQKHIAVFGYVSMLSVALFVLYWGLFSTSDSIPIQGAPTAAQQSVQTAEKLIQPPPSTAAKSNPNTKPSNESIELYSDELQSQHAITPTVEPVAEVAVEINEELNAFLSSYGYQNYYERANEAVEMQDIEVFERLFKYADKKLVVSKLPIDVADYPKYLFLNKEGNQFYLLFWKPKIKLADFYFGMQSEEVKELQLLLKRHGFLKTRIDSTIGSKTIYAIVQFQRKIGVKATGQLDNATLFHLEHY